MTLTDMQAEEALAITPAAAFLSTYTYDMSSTVSMTPTEFSFLPFIIIRSLTIRRRIKGKDDRL